MLSFPLCDARAQPARETQPPLHAGWRIEAGAVASSPFVEDGNGVTARAGVGPWIAVGALRPAGSRVGITAGLQGSMTPMRLRSAETHWRAGTTRRIDARIGGELAVVRGLSVAASAVVARSSGPGDVIPFRASGGALWMWGAESAVAFRVTRAPALALMLAGDLARMGDQRDEDPPMKHGWVGRVRLGLRHEFP